MKNNKDRWLFHNLEARPRLSTKEVAYWKNALSKILKVGLEFEFNLPEKKEGTCRGDSRACPCSQMTLGNDCWQECLRESKCKMASRSTAGCENVTGTCEDEDCATCYHYHSRCPGFLCSDFVGKCIGCGDYKLDCSSCKYAYDPKKSPRAIRDDFKIKLMPNNSYGVVSPTGVHSIKGDGSLLGDSGAEIITVGRRIDYFEFFKMAEEIIKTAEERGAYLNERCSIHMHVLASYYGKLTQDRSVPRVVSELERDMPEIILANLHQLVRRYQNAMTWMTMGLDDEKHLTRWEKFRVSVIDISAIGLHMREVSRKVSDNAGGNKYAWINYNNSSFSSSGDVGRFHVEFRAADGLMSPSAVAAIACMYYALVIKAVEISRYGVVEIGDSEWLGQAREIRDAMMNNNVPFGRNVERFSYTEDLYKYYDTLIAESLDLVHQLKPILIRIGPAFDVLEKLAEAPVALRRVGGDTWEKIENTLRVEVSEEDQLDVALSEIITLNQVSNCETLEEWVREVHDILNQAPAANGISAPTTEESVYEYIRRHSDEGRIVWSNRIGSPIII